MSDLATVLGSAQPAPTGTVPQVGPSGKFGSVPTNPLPSVTIPEPQSEALTEMPTGAMPFAVAPTEAATEVSGTMPISQMTEPPSAQPGDMPKGEMPQS
jgi:hypothetical protein